MRKTAVSAIALAMGVGFAGAETIDVGSFDYRASVTFPGYTLDSTLENFPVLVRLTAVEGGFSYGTASVDGSDIRFALADGTILPSEVALWNPKGESQIWVSVPVLEKETSILMYWGGERDFPASQTDGSVWSAAGYFAVWHMDEASDAALAKDSTAGARDGTHTGTAPGQDGIAGRSVRISNGGWNVADKKGIPTASCAGLGNQFVFSLWTKYPNQNPGTDRLASNKTDWQASDGWEISTQRYSQDKIDMRGSNKDQNPQPPVMLKNTDWQHLVFVFNKATGTTYVNNSWKKDGTIGSVVDNDNIFTIGNASGLGSDSFKGWMDEVRLYKGIPGREWISAEYKSIKDTGFAVVGACESLATDEPIPGAITVASVDLHAVSLDWGVGKTRFVCMRHERCIRSRAGHLFRHEYDCHRAYGIGFRLGYVGESPLWNDLLCRVAGHERIWLGRVGAAFLHHNRKSCLFGRIAGHRRGNGDGFCEACCADWHGECDGGRAAGQE